MELDREESAGLVHYPLVCPVICVDKPFFPLFWQCLCVNCKAVVLGCNVASFCAKLKAGLVLASVPIFQLVIVCSCGQGKKLIAQAYSKYCLFHFNQLLDIFNCCLAH